MLFDKQTMPSNAQAITVTAVSTDKFHMQGGLSNTGTTAGFTTDNMGNTVPNDIGRSPEVDVIFTVSEQFAAAGAATLNIDLVADNDPALGSPTILASSGAIAKATLKPGYQVKLSGIPVGIAAADLYLGASYTVATGPMTAGKMTMALIGKNGKQTAPNTFT